MSIKQIKGLFAVAACYDIGAGLIFCLFYMPLYRAMNLILPEHPGYLQLASLYIAVFGIGFAFVARSPESNMGVIVLGILMKIVFAGVIFYHYFVTIAPKIYVVFALCDAIFAALFLGAYRSLSGVQREASG